MQIRVKARWLWAVPAAANIAVGVALATHPDRWTDVETIRRWTGQWLFAGTDLYADLRSGTDYPPHAIVLLSPLALVPGALVAPVWSCVNLALMAAAGYLAARLVRPQASSSDALYLTLLFLCWSGTKTLVQFSLLTLVCGVAAVVFAQRRPVLAGLSLGLSLMKPQIAFPFALWMLFARRSKVVAIAAAFVACGVAIFCIRADASPLDVVVRYTEILRAYYAGGSAMYGVSQLRPLLAFLGIARVDLVTAIASTALLAFICAEAFNARDDRSQLAHATLGLGAVWSLLTFYHLTYGFVLLLPLGALLLLDDQHAQPKARLALFWAMQCALMIDVPAIWRRTPPSIAENSASGWPAHVDEMMMMCLFVALAVMMKHRRAPEPVVAISLSAHSSSRVETRHSSSIGTARLG